MHIYPVYEVILMNFNVGSRSRFTLPWNPNGYHLWFTTQHGISSLSNYQVQILQLGVLSLQFETLY